MLPSGAEGSLQTCSGLPGLAGFAFKTPCVFVPLPLSGSSLLRRS